MTEQLALQLEPAATTPDALNREGLTWGQWFAGTRRRGEPTKELRAAWRNGDDPTEYHPDLCDRIMTVLSAANRRAEEDLQELRGLHAEILGCPVEELDQRVGAQKAEEDRLRQESRSAAPARASTRGKAAKGGDAIGIGRAALSDRQRELLAHIKVENNLAVYTSPERIADWDLLKRVMLALGGTWKTGGKKAPGGFRFPDDLDAAELVRLAKESGEITDPKVAEYFWTDNFLANELATFIDPQPDDCILEPSAGEGALVEAIHRRSPQTQVDCVEPLERNRGALEALGLHTRLISQEEEDFLQLTPPPMDALYDAVIANPPFGRRADVIHITRMLEWLKPGGRLAAIASSGVKHRDDARGREFRALIESHGGAIIDNPAGLGWSLCGDRDC
jgi:hypothetical protein